MRPNAEPSRHTEIARKLHRLVDDLSVMIEMMDEHMATGPVEALVPVETQADADRAFALLHAEPAGVA